MTEVDTNLFERAASGDQDAFWQLLLPYRGLIYSVALGMLKNHERAEDQLHDVYLKAFRSMRNLRDPKKLPSWLYSVTRNHIYDGMRREMRLRKASHEAATVAMARVVPVSELTEKETTLTLMEEAMAHLPEPFRVILGMKYMNDYSCKEIAEILHITLSAVKSRLFEARKLLRKRTEAMSEEKSMKGEG